MPRKQMTIQIQIPVSDKAVGGGVRHASSLARGLRELGVRVSLLRTGEPRPDRDCDFDQVITCQPRSLPLLWRYQPFGSAPFWIRTIRKAAAHVDAVIALAAAPAFATRWAWPKKPLMFAPAILDKVERPESPRSPYKWFETKAFQYADRVLVRTQAVRAAIEGHYLPLRCPVGIALPGVDDRHASNATRTRQQLGVPADAKLLITMGLVNENKGQRYIAEALARCARPNWWWAIVGTGDDEPAIRAALRGSDIENRTLFVGVDPRAADWYAAADLLVASSRHETFGQAIAEALWVGLPVVIPQNQLGVALSPLAEHVERYRLGHTFKRCDADSLVNTLTQALGDEHELRETGRRAAAFASANFKWSNYAECALRLFESSSDVIHDTHAPSVSNYAPTPASDQPRTTGVREPAETSPHVLAARQ